MAKGKIRMIKEDKIIKLLSEIIMEITPFKSIIEKVKLLTIAIAQKLKLSKDELACLKSAASIYPIGQLYIILDLVHKIYRNTELTPEENFILRQEPSHAEKIIKDVFPKKVRKTIYSYMENWDGTGVPSGLKEEDIPILARIIAIANRFCILLIIGYDDDSISSNKKIKENYKNVLAEIEKESGSKFDPELVEILNEFFNQRNKNLQFLRKLYLA